MTINVVSTAVKQPDEKPVEPKGETPSAPVVPETTEQKEPAKSDIAETEEVETESKDDAEELEASGDDKDKPKKKGGFQRRIDKLNAAKADAQREAEYWKQEALKSVSQSQARAKSRKES
jgi:hypothetical protein